MTNTFVNGINIFDNRAYSYEINHGIIQNIRQIDSYNHMNYICPGLIDTQVNGYKGIDYSSPTLSEEGIVSICREFRKHGISQHFATIVTRPNNIILKNIKTIINAKKNNPYVDKSISGIHIEGPFISPDDGPRGAHDSNYVKSADIGLLDSWLEAAKGVLKTITIAPEIPNAIELIAHAKKRGLICSIGHTSATPEDIRKAVRAGAKISTHLGNGSANKINRLNNHIWAQLAEDSLFMSIISDNEHLPPEVVKVFARAKILNKIILISDMSPLAGLAPGVSKWGNIVADVTEQGPVRLHGTPYLAGASSFLLKNLENFIQITENSLSESIKLCTVNPTRLYNLNPDRINLSVGTPFDAILLHFDEQLKILRVMKNYLL